MLLIDNYDSFTYNLAALIAEVTGVSPVVVRNDTKFRDLPLADVDAIVISPGPGTPRRPADLGVSAAAILDAGLPVLGVCLGHQAIAHLLGGSVGHSPEPMHGRRSRINHGGSGIFAGLPEPFEAVRYHSLTVSELPDGLTVTARTEDGAIMGLAHRVLPLWGVQFHPESILTEHGQRLIANFAVLASARDRRRRRSTTFRPATNHLAPRRQRSEQYRVHVRRLGTEPDPEQALSTLFNGAHRFWLDSAGSGEPRSRFSFLGDDSGPLAQYLQYHIGGAITVSGPGGVQSCRGPFLRFLGRQLAERRVPVPDGLPFEFNLGYVGYLGYELKCETGGRQAHHATTPDAAFLFADRMLILDHQEHESYLLTLSGTHPDGSASASAEMARSWLNTAAATARGLPRRATRPSRAPAVLGISTVEDAISSGTVLLRHSRDEYLGLINACLTEIHDGEAYEICLTNSGSTPAGEHFDRLRAYRRLRVLNPAPFAALLDFPGIGLLSASPERFLRITADGLVESRPIKGTRPRGATPNDDDILRRDLATSEKDRAENLMIVDLVRNDLNRVCAAGTVHVPAFCTVETYAQAHQLVSVIQGRLRPGLSAVDVVQAAFPGGSMTGAPKIRAMELIDRLEAGPRGAYSGALGWFALSGAADLNIIIRTLIHAGNTLTFGTGGAILALSHPTEEYEETLVKAAPMATISITRAAAMKTLKAATSRTGKSAERRAATSVHNLTT